MFQLQYYLLSDSSRGALSVESRGNAAVIMVTSRGLDADSMDAPFITLWVGRFDDLTKPTYYTTIYVSSVSL